MQHTETAREAQDATRKGERKETRVGAVVRKTMGGGNSHDGRAAKMPQAVATTPARKRPPRVNVADELLASLTEAADIMAGKVAPSRFYPARAKVDVRAIRRQFGLSQPDFAQRFGFNLATLREWEQGRRQPEAAARVLLLVIAAHPAAVEDVLARDVPVAA